MARLKNTILGNVAYGTYAQNPQVDVRQGGQNGPMTDFSSFVSNSAYVRRNLIAILIEAPRGFQDLTNGNGKEVYTATLKALIELLPKSIEGLQATLTVEYVENAAGGAGEMQEDISNVTRTRSTPTFTWTEKYGMPIGTFLRTWTQGLLMDPITKVPAVVSQTGNRPSDLLPDYTGMTVLFFEPDPTMQWVTAGKAWLCTNMMPKTTGDLQGHRDLTQPGESLDYSIEFTSLTQVGVGVELFAQAILEQMDLTGLNPNLQAAFTSAISADVDAANNGYSEMMSDEAQNRVA